jgi:hypothetical protein
LKSSEFGVTGKLIEFPTVFPGEVMGTIVLKQAVLVPQLVELTYTVAFWLLVPVGVTVKFTTFSG